VLKLFTVDANYWQTRNIAQPLCESTASCWYSLTSLPIADLQKYRRLQCDVIWTGHYVSLHHLHVQGYRWESKFSLTPNKNLAIANRSRVSCAHNTLRVFISISITPWPWNLGKRSLKVIENGTIWFEYGLLFAFHSNYGRILDHFGDMQRRRMAWPWNLGFGSFKVTDNGAVRQTMYDFLLVRHCNYSSILYRMRVIWRWIISWPWNLA